MISRRKAEESTLDFLRRNSVREGGCLLWQGAISSAGYGMVRDEGAAVLVHRFAYETLVAAIPDDLLVLHRCDVKRCWEPNHLFVGTHQDNSDDKLSKAREARGSKHGMAELTEITVLQILAAIDEGQSRKQASKQFGVNYYTLCDVLNGRTWRHIVAKYNELCLAKTRGDDWQYIMNKNYGPKPSYDEAPTRDVG